MLLKKAEKRHPGIPTQAGRRYAVVAMYVAAALTPLLVFVFPFFVPTPAARAVSASDLAGFSNRAAIVSAVGLSVLVLVLSWWQHRGDTFATSREEGFPGLGRRFVGTVLAATAILQGFAGWMILSAHQRNLGDAGYFIEQATVRAATGRALYTQIEFAYGPLLFFPEVWLSGLLHCSVGAAYFVLLVTESAVGLLMLAYVLDHLPIRQGMRRAAFLLLAVAAITPHFGLNYTLFRFASPLFVLLCAMRVRTPFRCTAWMTAGVVFESLISPELGFATAAGVLVFGAVRAGQSGPRWLSAATVPLVVLATLLLTLGRPFLHMASMFSRGALNLPVGPYPHILFLLFALVWLVPRTLSRELDLRSENSAKLLALYGTSIAFMPAALNRCDPLHVVFNGTGIWVLALMAFNRSSVRARTWWVASLAFVVLWDQRVNYRIFQYRDAVTVREAVLNRLPARVQSGIAGAVAHVNPYLGFLLSRRAQPEGPVDMAALERLVGSAPVATPMEISPKVEAQLQAAHLYSPGYFAFWTDTMNLGTEERIVAFTDAHEWLLLPSSWQHGFLQLPKDTGYFQGLNLRYKQRKPVLYNPGDAFNEDLDDNWTRVWSFGAYVLYKHSGQL